ncbi:murein DD-endopeptidase MepM/ murein hydrolase activator NlpD [Sedimentibacter acidaminivorans]|uniref:Murein DD-endopeptidase MepM/ murein hydrolase activator NlpD n=1 Tax=Sedimentibacter acidaminivorans TaxID=913099 RepID=A0ABS4GGI3_9FIRM|nr:M23 family metallopeptidase [Sedimentibacter acidaminivorans]MBP1926801.1 murein DD-endopeptidase MepM/ murein hydrolase activator NlpD [Sedimentibacter acidaminivorans]
MIIKIKLKILYSLVVLILISGLFYLVSTNRPSSAVAMDGEKGFIKWVDFGVSYEALDKALKADIKSIDNEVKLDWIELLSYLASRYGGNFSRYKAKDMDDLINKLNNGESIEKLTEKLKYYNYFHEAYTAVLGGFVGGYEIEVDDENNPGQKKWIQKYGLKAFSPIARGYYYNHYDDFGNSRDYGFRRVHLGNDLMGSVGTPVIAVESGTIEALGWNQYGGWRVGIRSFDQKRYYYYAHLKKDHPYHSDLKVGDTVYAGDVIGYMGRTGYSRKENVNNINTTHLHFGMQLIFDESQKETLSEIWIDVYNIVRLLSKNKSPVSFNSETKDFNRIYNIRFFNMK